jgi:hypothetical protein
VRKKKMAADIKMPMAAPMRRIQTGRRSRSTTAIVSAMR